ncbi:MAG: hypothetical protein U0324_18995 [Polyangiales bacterium]
MLAEQKASAALEQVQRPAAHDWPGGHVTPHAPQLAGSVIRSTQRLIAEQYERLPAPAQMQRPPVHDWPAMQALPQAPQLFGSVIRLEHPRPGQKSWPAGHICWQKATAPDAPPSRTPASPGALDDMHTSPPAHSVPQRPQLRVSVRRLTQALPHTSGSLAGHARHTARVEAAASPVPPSTPASMADARAVVVQMRPAPQPWAASPIARTSSG